MKSLRIVYMGTPDFAVLPLQHILDSNHEVVAVVTAPDKPAGRGRKMRGSAVKEFAQKHDLRVLQPEKLRSEAFIQTLSELRADVFVVVAFRMLPEMVWQLPSIGTFNLHASLLPQYRGAAPINWAVINGEHESGVTTFMINAQIDTGSILLQEKVQIDQNESAGSLHDKLMVVGAELVIKTLNGLAEEKLIPRPQEEHSYLKPAPKIFKEDCRIDWFQPGKQIEQLIRGLSPFPGAFTEIVSGELIGQLKILEAEFLNETSNHDAGSFYIHDKELRVSTQDGCLRLMLIQPQGKRRMGAIDVINGLKNKTEIMKMA